MATTKQPDKTLVRMVAGALLAAGIAGYGLYATLPNKRVTKAADGLTVTYSEYRATPLRDRKCEIKFTKDNTDSLLNDMNCDDAVDSVSVNGREDNVLEIKRDKENEYS